jgi:hypothetical protein
LATTAAGVYNAGGAPIDPGVTEVGMTRSGRGIVFAILLLPLSMIAAVAPARGQPMLRGGRQPAGAKGTVNLPYRPAQTDAFGNAYFIYQGGWFRQQGNMPVYSEGAQLLVNGNAPSMNNNLGRVEDNGELVIENMTLQGQGQGATVTRRLLINGTDGFIRVIDVYKNGGGQDINLPVMYRASMNYGITSSQPIADPKKQGQSIGIVATDNQGRSVVEIYGGRGSKLAPQVSAQPNNSWVQANVNLTIPAGKEIAVMHLHAVVQGADAGQKLAANLKESKLLTDVPKQIRKMIVNFPGGNLFIGDGDVEILRGDAFDAAEMRGGDQIKGTLKEASYKLNTFYGPVELPADKVISLINVGESRPRQLIVTADGQIFGGKLEKNTVDLELSSGQVTKLPLSQITRLGYRKRGGEPDEWTFDKPTVLLRTGERIAVEMPDGDITVYTRYGALKLKPTSIASLAFQNEENGVHEIYLTDGSKFAGLVGADVFEMKLADGKGQTVKFPASTIGKLQLNSKVDDADDATPVMKLANEDLLVANLTGQYKLDTAFDTLTLSGEQIKSITHSKTSPLDVVVRLWDETSVSGQLEEQEFNCQLKSGVAVKVPVALVAEYMQPQPKPADTMVERVKKVVESLNADDWKARDAAQKQLVAMGASIAPILKQLRNDQPPEAQQRIDDVLQTLKGPVAPPVTAQPEN